MSIYAKYIDSAKGSQEAMLVSSEDGQPFGDPSYLSGSTFDDTPWATLEPKSWRLDGSRRLIEDEPPADSIGWWSKTRSDDGGSFSGGIFPAIRLHFGLENTFSAPGITFRFWPSLGEWCSAMRVTWYYVEPNYPNPDSEDNIVLQRIVFPDASDWTLKEPVDQFNIIDIEFLSTNIPGHFAKLQSIQVGCVHFFFSDEIVRVSLLNEVDPSACELSADELTVEILEKYGRQLTVSDNQKMEFYQDGKVIASHYIQKFTREGENKYIFECNSVIALLEDTFLGGMYDEQPLYLLLLNDVLQGVSFSLDQSLNSATVSGYLPVCTRRQALQQIAFAVGAVITTQGDGTIQINAIGDLSTNSPTSGFNKDSIMSGATLTQEKPPLAIQVTAHRYTKSDDVEILLENTPLAADTVLVFDEPHWGYELEGDLTNVGLEEHDNWVKILVSDLSNITLTGKKYVHATEDYSTGSSSSGSSNTVKSESATLVTSENVQNVLDRLNAYYNLTNTLSGTVVVKRQKAGDMVEIANPYGSDLTVGYITSMESQFTTNGHTARINVKGAARAADEAEVLNQ